MTETNQTNSIPGQPGPYSEAAPQPTPPAAANGYGSPGMVRAGETESGEAVWLDARGVHAATMATLTVELAAAYEALSGVQARCTALLEERRAVDWTAQLRSMFIAFDQVVGERPHWPDAATVKLRRKLLVEETQETLDALDARDLPEVVDGVIDTCVVALGLLVAFGVDPRPIWDEVMVCNLRKAGGPKSSDGKIMKRPGFVGPDIERLLREQGWRP